VGLERMTPEGYDKVIDRIVPAARQLASQGANAISVMGTSLTFYKGAAFNQQLKENITKATGLPSTTMSTAIVEGLKAVGGRRLAVATAYNEEVSGRLRVFLEESGFEVLTVKGMGIERFQDRAPDPERVDRIQRERVAIGSGGRRASDLVRCAQDAGNSRAPRAALQSPRRFKPAARAVGQRSPLGIERESARLRHAAFEGVVPESLVCWQQRGLRCALKQHKLLRRATDGTQPGDIPLHLRLFPQVPERLAQNIRGNFVTRHCEPVVHPLPFAPGSRNSRLAQVRQVARNLGLARPQDFHEVANANFAVRNEIEQPQAGGVRQRPEKQVDGNSRVSLRHEESIHHICLDIYERRL